MFIVINFLFQTSLQIKKVDFPVYLAWGEVSGWKSVLKYAKVCRLTMGGDLALVINAKNEDL